jgi:hypothetical protein
MQNQDPMAPRPGLLQLTALCVCIAGYVGALAGFLGGFLVTGIISGSNTSGLFGLFVTGPIGGLVGTLVGLVVGPIVFVRSVKK